MPEKKRAFENDVLPYYMCQVEWYLIRISAKNPQVLLQNFLGIFLQPATPRVPRGVQKNPKLQENQSAHCKCQQLLQLWMMIFFSEAVAGDHQTPDILRWEEGLTSFSQFARSLWWAWKLHRFNTRVFSEREVFQQTKIQSFLPMEGHCKQYRIKAFWSSRFVV